MRGVPVRIARSIRATVEGHTLTQTGETNHTKKVRWAKRCALGTQEAVPSKELEEVQWKQLFASTTHSCDSRRIKPTPQHPDFRLRKAKVPLWLNKWRKPVGLNCQLATIGDGLKTTVETESTAARGRASSTANAVHLGFEVCWKVCLDGNIREAVDGIDILLQMGCHVPSNLFYRVLKRCIQSKDLTLGRRIHGLTARGGYEGDAFLATHLIGLYATHGRLEEAMEVFVKVRTPDSYNWASIIFAYVRHGGAAEAAKAVRLYRQMCQSSHVKPDNHLYSAVLKACADAKDVIAGKDVHARIIARSGKPDRFVQAGLVNMYAKCGNLDDARRVFDKISDRNVVTWTAMIAGYAQQGLGREALVLYSSMQQAGLSPDSVTYVCLLQACASIGVGALHEGRQLHAQIEKQGLEDDAVLGGSLVDMYAKCGSVEDARRLFDKLPQKNVVAWTAMIAGYAHQSMGQEALSLYSSMQQSGLTPDSVTYICLLQACVSVGVGALYDGKKLHLRIGQQGLEELEVIGGSLINMYSKCGSLEDARAVFDKLADRNVIAWNAMIAGYAQQGMGQDALSLYSSMREQGISPNHATYACLLQACASVGVAAINEGKQLHVQIEERGMEDDPVLGGSLVNMYAKCGSLEDAHKLFDKLAARNVETWTAMIAGYAQHGCVQKALSLYRSMQQASLTPANSVTFVCLLQACASAGAGALVEGKKLHAQIAEQRLEEDLVLSASLVNMYAKCGSLGHARQLFDKLLNKNVVTWTVMIAGYARCGMGQKALSLYSSMRQESVSPNFVTYVCLLQACASVGRGALREGKHLHAQIKERGLEEDVILGGSVVNMYAKCGSLEEARRLFDKLPDRNVVAWTAMIAGYAQQGMGLEALSVYRGMKQEGLVLDSVTYVCLLQACASTGVSALLEGKQLHAEIEQGGLQGDSVLGGCLVDMYAKCGRLEDARGLFNKLPQRSIEACNAMIAGYCQQGLGQEALGIYTIVRLEGLTPDAVTYVCLLQACASLGVGALEMGRQLHAQVEERGMEDDVVLGGSLVNMYVKCGSLVDACRVFDKHADSNLATWNAMIAGYVQQGMGQKALSLYKSLEQAGLTPDSVTYVCLLKTCAAVAALPLGMELHAEIKERGMHNNDNVGAALVNMYAKCGSIYDSQQVFDSLSVKSLEAWNALVSGYAYQGDSQAVFDLLGQMRQEGVHPDHITFLSVLTVCSNVGLVDEGRAYFASMWSDYGINATMEHYVCMVDLLGRAGHLCEALQIAKAMPFPPNGVVWHTLLGACQKWKDVEIGLQAYYGAVSIDERDAAAYVLMSNICASTQMWEVAKEMKAKQTNRGASKKPGQSWWIDMGGVVHTFCAGAKKNAESEGIYSSLEQLIQN